MSGAKRKTLARLARARNAARKRGRTITQGGKIEAKKIELDHACVRFERHHDVRRLQEEGAAATAAPTTTCSSTYGFA